MKPTKEFTQTLTTKLKILEECKSMLRHFITNKMMEEQKKIIEEREKTIFHMVNKKNQLEMDNQCLRRLVSNKDLRINELEDILRPVKDATFDIKVSVDNMHMRSYITNTEVEAATDIEALLKEVVNKVVKAIFYQYKLKDKA